MINVNLIIEEQFCDIDSDIVITFNDEIQNAKEPDKVFGGYSNTFLLPATQNNAKIFGRWEQESAKGSLDARYAYDAEIQINGATWRKGKVRLLSASTKGGVAVDYKVAFTGQTTTLKDIIGDDSLEQLDLSAYDHSYDEATVRTGLTTSLSSGAIRYPLIYHTNRYVYTTQFEIAGGTAALDYRELKPAIALTAIMDAIEARYSGITWATGGFWDDTTIFDKLYLWCHRAEGQMVGGSEMQQIETPYSDWVLNTGSDPRPLVSRLDVQGSEVEQTYFNVQYQIIPNDSSLYDVIIYDEISGTEVVRALNQSGTQTYTGQFRTRTQNFDVTYQPGLRVQTTDGLASYTVTIQVDEVNEVLGAPSTSTSTFTTSTTTYNMTNEIVVASQIPKMKIIDFISGIFKMFNLTLYYNSSDEIVVETLDNFYAGGSTWDLTKYLDVDYTVDRIAPYSQIDFKFADKSSKLAIKWDEEFSTNSNATYGISRKYGELSYLDKQKRFDGGSYSIEIPFEKMLFERQIDSSSNLTTIHSGLFVDQSDDPAVGEPLIMVIENVDTTSYPIRWLTASNSTTYNRPHNTKLTGTDQSINFNAEIDSYDYDIEENSLFATYWDTYIGELYNRNSRKYRVSGRLPATFVQNYTLADEIRAFGIRFRIETIKIDVNTGDATLTLRNIPQDLP